MSEAVGIGDRQEWRKVKLTAVEADRPPMRKYGDGDVLCNNLVCSMLDVNSHTCRLAFQRRASAFQRISYPDCILNAIYQARH